MIRTSARRFKTDAFAPAGQVYAALQNERDLAPLTMRASTASLSQPAHTGLPELDTGARTPVAAPPHGVKSP